MVVGRFDSVKVNAEWSAGDHDTRCKRKESSVHFGRKTGEDSGVSGQMCEVDFMVKLLRACVWMPWRK